MKLVTPKKKAIFILLLLISVNAFSQKKVKKNTSCNMFRYHLNILDSAAKKKYNDTVTCCSVSIAYMVEHTDVKVQTEGTTFGFLFFTKSELNEWHKWYNKKCGMKRK